jgi:uncharacterized protein HemX
MAKAPTKTTKRKAAPKKATTTRAKTSAVASQARSFKLEKNPDFFTFQPTIQTFYWLIIGVLVIGLTIWVYMLQQQITQIYDSIEINNLQEEIITVKPKVQP